MRLSFFETKSLTLFSALGAISAFTLSPVIETSHVSISSIKMQIFSRAYASDSDSRGSGGASDTSGGRSGTEGPGGGGDAGGGGGPDGGRQGGGEGLGGAPTTAAPATGFGYDPLSSISAPDALSMSTLDDFNTIQVSELDPPSRPSTSRGHGRRSGFAHTGGYDHGRFSDAINDAVNNAVDRISREREARARGNPNGRGR